MRLPLPVRVTVAGALVTVRAAALIGAHAGTGGHDLVRLPLPALVAPAIIRVEVAELEMPLPSPRLEKLDSSGSCSTPARDSWAWARRSPPP